MNQTPMMKAFALMLFILIPWCIQAQNQIVNGKKHGEWEVRFEERPNGLRYKGTFDMGVPVEVFTHYHPNGSPRAIMQFIGKTQACKVTEYAPNGLPIAEGRYSDPGVKDSVWRIYDGSGKLLNLETYEVGMLNGLYQTYYPNGRVVESGQMKAGEKEGLWVRLDEAGGKLHTSTYVKGELEGLWTDFDGNGRISRRGDFHENMRHGKWLAFTDGKPVKALYYHQGRITKEVAY